QQPPGRPEWHGETSKSAGCRRHPIGTTSGARVAPGSCGSHDDGPNSGKPPTALFGRQAERFANRVLPRVIPLSNGRPAAVHRHPANKSSSAKSEYENWRDDTTHT